MTRYYGAGEYSTLGSLLSFGALAGVASTGIQNAIMFDIVAHHSFGVVTHHLKRLGVVGIALMATSPLVAHFLRVSIVSAAGGLAFAVITLWSCVPVAMLLAHRRVVSIAVLNFAQAVVRVAAIVPLRHAHPVVSTLVVSMGAALVGASGMAISALSSESTPLSGVREQGTPIAQYLLGGILFLPIMIPTWLARHTLDATRAGTFALAVLLGTTVVMFAGPVTSVVTPRVRDGERGRVVRDGLLITGIFALGAALMVRLAAPVILPRIESAPLYGLTSDLGPLLIGSVVWSLALYLTWVDVAGHGEAKASVGLAAGATGVEVGVALAFPSESVLKWGPSLSVCVYLLGMWAIRRIRINDLWRQSS
ncbi:MAG: hypothetical protein HKL87_01675 [Acidimicrobiaceae bacterium]|nr:hypothetical protein [Acidimicrobiaceae bacterium]